MANTGNWQEKQAIDDAVRQAKQDYANAAAKGDKAAMASAHAAAEAERKKAATIGYTTYTANTDTLYYAVNYSPGESTNRPPAWMDWDDDGIVDVIKNGDRYDANGNKLNNGGVGDWRVNPDNWDYKGPNNGGFEPIKTTQSAPVYTPPYTPVYTPSKPTAPQAPLQEPPHPGPKPTHLYEYQSKITKYEYVYGIKDLVVKGSEFSDKSIYVSKPFNIPGNIMQVSLQATEDHPIFSSISGEAADRQTSVEYYITNVENPTLNDWYAILPEGQSKVECELLLFESARTASLRFPANPFEETKVYKNGVEFKEWSFTLGGTQIQLLNERDVFAKYTISYTPNDEIVDPWNLDIPQKGLKVGRQVDTFPKGTDHNKTITLSKYPYVDYEQVNLDGDWDPNTGYKPITVSLRNANIAGPDRTTIKEVLPKSGSTGQKIYTENITDYETKQWKVPQAYSLVKDAQHTVFEYWHEGNKLYFSETFNKSGLMENQEFNHGDAEIEVAYDYLISNFRLKIILRRTGPAATSVSPAVHDYLLKFKVMK